MKKFGSGVALPFSSPRMAGASSIADVNTMTLLLQSPYTQNTRQPGAGRPAWNTRIQSLGAMKSADWVSFVALPQPHSEPEPNSGRRRVGNRRPLPPGCRDGLTDVGGRLGPGDAHGRGLRPPGR